MIVITKGGFDPPRTRRKGLQIAEDVALDEHNPTIAVWKEGYFRLEMETIIPPSKPIVDSSGQVVACIEEPITRPTGVKTLIGPITSDMVWVSPLVGDDFNFDDFPENWQFGHGLTSDSINITIFPYGTVLTSGQLRRMAEVFEGTPPGNPERNVWREFDVNGRDPAIWNLDGTLRE